MTRIVTSVPRPKRPPKKRKAVALDVPAVVTAKRSRHPLRVKQAAAEVMSRLNPRRRPNQAHRAMQTTPRPTTIEKPAIVTSISRKRARQRRAGYTAAEPDDDPTDDTLVQGVHGAHDPTARSRLIDARPMGPTCLPTARRSLAATRCAGGRRRATARGVSRHRRRLRQACRPPRGRGTEQARRTTTMTRLANYLRLHKRRQWEQEQQVVSPPTQEAAGDRHHQAEAGEATARHSGGDGTRRRSEGRRSPAMTGRRCPHATGAATATAPLPTG